MLDQQHGDVLGVAHPLDLALQDFDLLVVEPGGGLVDVVDRGKTPRGWLEVLDAHGAGGNPVTLVHADDPDLRRLARGFEGAWPYLQLIAAANRVGQEGVKGIHALAV